MFYFYIKIANFKNEKQEVYPNGQRKTHETMKH